MKTSARIFDGLQLIKQELIIQINPARRNLHENDESNKAHCSLKVELEEEI